MNANKIGKRKKRVRSFFQRYDMMTSHDFYGPPQLWSWLTWIEKRKNVKSTTPNIVSYFLSKIPSSATILDFGCGNGWATMYILRRKPSVFVIGIDITPRLIREARTKREKLGVRDHCEFILGDCTQMPFRDEAFDTLIDLNVIHHLSLIQEGVIGIHHALKEGGYVFVAEAVTNNLLILISRRLSSRFKLSFSSGTEIDFTSNQLAQFLNSVGFQIMRKSYDDYFLWILVTLAKRYPRIIRIIPKPILLLLVYIEAALQRFPVLHLSGGAIFFVCQKLPT